ncbi:hypothetical protein llap_15083 [Limosa lapponica baueri]|uniref:Uncharacterized protein n=1 Tax=Limosa lapponica baueri TaxID=1758121 RepID=A0A2I0TLH8_LIMLA|nr:hypothetical protein llap_15083 [Limosa lapponica baueri]
MQLSSKVSVATSEVPVDTSEVPVATSDVSVASHQGPCGHKRGSHGHQQGDPVATILLSPFTWTSARREACALAVEGDASAEVIPGSQLITPHGADRMLLFPGSLPCVDDNYAKIWEVIVLA